MERVVGVDLLRQGDRGRRLVVVAAILCATLLVAAPAHAQMPGGPGAIDQYVEDVPTGGGKVHPTNEPPAKTPVPGGVQQQIEAAGGADAPLLTEIVSSAQYGAPQEKAGKSGGGSAQRMERGGSTPEAAPAATVEATGVLEAAVSAVEGGDGRRLLGLLAALLAVSVGTVVSVGLRQRRT